MESLKLLLENTFAMKEEFSNNEALGFVEAFQTRRLHDIRAAGQRILHSSED
jgi:hypothetical protein